MMEPLLAAPAEQPYRTAFHFQPPQNWMNDPNGLMCYNEVYHFFYQHNPSGPLFEIKQHWGHAVSKDLINWTHLEVAFTPSHLFDINGCWSGSATVLPGNKPIMLYTGRDSEERQVQNLACPKDLSDPYLKEWVKHTRNPVIDLPEGIEKDQFRDPCTAWIDEDGKWRLLVGSQRNKTGIAFLYQSDDCVNWTQSNSPFYQVANTGTWECPEFFPVFINSTNGVDTSVVNPRNGVKHVLKVALQDQFHDYYVIGNYNPENQHYVPENELSHEKSLCIDYGRFYASQSFFDPVKNRRIIMAWVHETDSEENFEVRGWGGVQSFPRSIWLDENQTRLLQWPIEEIQMLHEKEVRIPTNMMLEGDLSYEIQGITADQVDVTISFKLPNLEDVEELDPDMVDPLLICTEYDETKKKHVTKKGKFGPFGLLALATDDFTEQTAISFSVFRRNGRFVVVMCSDQSRSSTSTTSNIEEPIYAAFVDIDPEQDEISLRTLIDHSIIESFGEGGRTCITARVYPELAIGENARLFAFNNGAESVVISEMSAWSLKNARMNVLEPLPEKGIFNKVFNFIGRKLICCN